MAFVIECETHGWTATCDGERCGKCAGAPGFVPDPSRPAKFVSADQVLASQKLWLKRQEDEEKRQLLAAEAKARHAAYSQMMRKRSIRRKQREEQAYNNEFKPMKVFSSLGRGSSEFHAVALDRYTMAVLLGDPLENLLYG